MKFIDNLLRLSSGAGVKKRLFFTLGFFLLVGPMLAITYVNYGAFKQELTNSVYTQRESIAYLSAALLEEKFDRLIDVGISFATRVQFRKLISEGKWGEAMALLNNVPRDFPYFYQMGLFDPKGTLMSLYPFAGGVVGKNFAYRDYYKGVSYDWKPYLSDVFKVVIQPPYNVITIAVPIMSDDQKPLGFITLAVKLNTLAEWSKNIKVGKDGFVYFADKKGRLATDHPDFPLDATGDIVDLSAQPAVQRVLSGETGINTFINPMEKNEEELIAYQPVSKYGWGVFVDQPVTEAFAARDGILNRMVAVSILLTLIDILFIYLLLRIMALVNTYREQDKILLESVGDGLLAIDRSWNIILWNKAATALTGWREEEVLGKPFRDIVKFIREADRKENITFIEETMLLGKTHFMENHTLLVRKDGKEISVGDSASPLFDGRGRVSGAIIVFRDVSKEYELEAARQEFSSLATHQLRAPIGIIKGYLELLFEESQGALTAEQKDSLAKIRQVNERLYALVNAMLNVSRMESGAISIAPEPSYLPDLADEAVKEILPQIQEKKLQFEKQYDQDIPSVGVDPKLMGAIFRNLLSNAIKYTPDGGKITIKIGKKEQDILISVSDTGLGIPKEQQAMMFSKFFRADNVREKQTEGTGLGLYVVKAILEQSGGGISFVSPASAQKATAGREENPGTTFFVTIPLSGMKKKEGAKGLT